MNFMKVIISSIKYWVNQQIGGLESKFNTLSSEIDVVDKNVTDLDAKVGDLPVSEQIQNAFENDTTSWDEILDKPTLFSGSYNDLTDKPDIPDQVSAAVTEALTEAKESGEFDGENGTSVTVSSVTESTEDGGSNVVTFSDGNTLTVRNGTEGPAGKNGVVPVTGASVGQTVKITAVDATGVPTAWEPTAFPVTPESLPNPEPLIFSGAVYQVYDGSEEVTIAIPEGGGSSEADTFIVSGYLSEDGSAVDMLSATALEIAKAHEEGKIVQLAVKNNGDIGQTFVLPLVNIVGDSTNACIIFFSLTTYTTNCTVTVTGNSISTETSVEFTELQDSKDGVEAVTGATAGQIVQISEVDENGVPTAWVPVDMPSGGGDWELLQATSFTPNDKKVEIDLSSFGVNHILVHGIAPNTTNETYFRMRLGGANQEIVPKNPQTTYSIEYLCVVDFVDGVPVGYMAINSGWGEGMQIAPVLQSPRQTSSVLQIQLYPFVEGTEEVTIDIYGR